MTLFYVREMDGEDEMGLLVHADSARRAFDLWAAYYCGWNMPETARVYDVGGPALADSAIAWEALPRQDFKVEGR